MDYDCIPGTVSYACNRFIMRLPFAKPEASAHPMARSGFAGPQDDFKTILPRMKQPRLCLLPLLTAATLLWAVPGARALPVITNVAETGGDNEATDTITAKWTGNTWNRTVADEPTAGAVGTAFTLGTMKEDAPCYVDRNHQYNGATSGLPIPQYLVGGEYIMCGNDNRDNPDYLLEVSLNDSCYVYVLVDNRLQDGNNANPPTFGPNMQWLIDGGWEPMITGANRAANPTWPDEVGIDEGAGGTGAGVSIENFFSVYVKTVPAGSFQLYQADATGLNMYGVVVKPVPKTPFVSLARGDMRGVTFAVTDGSQTSLKPDSLSLTLDGEAITPQSVTKSGLTTTIAYRVDYPLASGSAHTSVLDFTDTATPPTAGSSTLNFTVQTYPTLPPAMSLASVDTSKPGFKARVFQYDNAPTDASQNIARGPGGTGLIPNVERQIAMGYINPETGQPYPNTASSDWLHAGGGTDTVGADGYFTVPDVINWNGTAPAAVGNFSVDSTPPFEDDTIPGIPGTSVTPTDRYVVSIETILELQRGAYRFGVNSDDGFRLSSGWGPGDVVGIQFGTAGDRGFTDTTMDFAVEADGNYPFRLMYFQTSGGQGCEFFVVNVETGVKTLINDLSATTPIKAYRESAVSRPYVSRVLPAIGDQFVIADMDLVVDITDGAIAVDNGSIALSLNGGPVTATPSKAGAVTTVRRAGSLADLFASGANNVSLVYSFTDGGTTTWVTNNWSFSVPAYTTIIPEANNVASAAVSGTGFTARNQQIDRSRDANQGNGGRYTGNGGGGNNLPRPEIQLANGYLNRTNNLPFDNLAPAGGNADGTWDIPAVLNFNSTTTGTADSGIFTGDVVVPGLPGTGTSNAGLDNFVQEIVMYLDLKAGAHLFGVNCDDGFVLSCAANPHDTLGTFLGRRDPGGGNSGSFVTAAAMNVIVPEDGIYPFRLLWWQGGGGVNVEFFTVDRDTGRHVLVNDTANTELAVPAFSTYTGATRPWVKFSAYPMPSMYQNQHQQSGPGPIKVVVGAGNPADIANDAPGIRPFGDAVGAVVADLGTETVGMVLNGLSVTPTVTDIAGTTDKLVLYTPDPPLASGSTNTAGLVYAGGTNYWTFTVITNVAVPASVAAPVSAADPSAVGFHVKVVQASAARPGGNTAAAAEDQLAGTPASVAIAGPEADGAYIAPGIINWNNAKNPGNTPSDIGNFQPLLGGPADDPVPGIPGTDLTGTARFENIAAEIFAWLELPAGYQKFGVNGDDGWKVQIGTPGQTDGPVLFSVDRGAGARDIPFAFITPQAGLYPVRLVWYQGGGGGNLEFFTYGPDNQKIPVNDRNNPLAIKAWYQANVSPPQISNWSLSGGSITVEWKNGGTLESAPGVTGPWTSTGHSDGSFSEAATGEARFYRVRR